MIPPAPGPFSQLNVKLIDLHFPALASVGDYFQILFSALPMRLVSLPSLLGIAGLCCYARVHSSTGVTR